MNKKNSSTIKKVIISLIVIAALVGGMFGARAYVSSGKTTPVMQVMNIADTWIDSGASGYGQISQGGTQLVYLDTTMLVSNIFVSPGDQVKQGDPLMQYDASQAKLQAESYGIRYEMAKRDLNEARQRLDYLKTFKPYVVPDPIYKIFKTRINVLLASEHSFDYDRFEGDSIKIEEIKKEDGTVELKYIIDVNLNTEISKEMMAYLLNYDETALNPPKPEPDPEPTPEPDPEPTPEPDPEPAPDPDAEPTPDPGSEPTPEPNPEPTPDPDLDPDEDISSVLPQKNFVFNIWESYQGMDSVLIATVGTKEKEDGIHRDAWIRETFDNKQKGYFTFEDIFKLLPNGNIEFNNANESVLNHAKELFEIKNIRENAYPDPVEIPEQNMYSQEEINEMILDQTQLIRSQEIEVSQAELNWKKAKQTATDGIVRSVQDGTVVAVGDPYAPQGDQALIQVKSGSGYEITSTISETQLNTIKVGDQISVMMWSNGMTYTGTITKISPYPAEYSMSYSGGEGGNMSYYPFFAELDCQDELQPWDGGEITFLSNAPTSKAEFALQSCFIREENGRNYVLKVDENDRMVKQYIEVGRILYGGYYVEVYSGLSLEDYIAFPYGKNAVEGAKADYDSGVMGW